MQTLRRLLLQLWEVFFPTRSLATRAEAMLPLTGSSPVPASRCLCDLPRSLRARRLSAVAAVAAVAAVGQSKNPSDPDDIAFCAWMYYLN